MKKIKLIISILLLCMLSCMPVYASESGDYDTDAYNAALSDARRDMSVHVNDGTKIKFSDAVKKYENYVFISGSSMEKCGLILTNSNKLSGVPQNGGTSLGLFVPVFSGDCAYFEFSYSDYLNFLNDSNFLSDVFMPDLLNIPEACTYETVAAFDFSINQKYGIELNGFKLLLKDSVDSLQEAIAISGGTLGSVWDDLTSQILVITDIYDENINFRQAYVYSYCYYDSDIRPAVISYCEDIELNPESNSVLSDIISDNGNISDVMFDEILKMFPVLIAVFVGFIGLKKAISFIINMVKKV